MFGIIICGLYDKISGGENSTQLRFFFFYRQPVLFREHARIETTARKSRKTLGVRQKILPLPAGFYGTTATSAPKRLSGAFPCRAFFLKPSGRLEFSASP